MLNLWISGTSEMAVSLRSPLVLKLSQNVSKRSYINQKREMFEVLQKDLGISKSEINIDVI
jgi:hypothetical protein